jgi:hypothetical protein
MATDDDKQIPEPDPWAGLDVGGAEDKGEEFTFSFDGLEDDTAASKDRLDDFPVDDVSAEHPSTDDEEDRVVASIHQEPSESDEHATGGDQPLDDGHHELVVDDIPLAVFPPPDAERTGSEVLIGTGRSGIISMIDSADAAGAEDADGRAAAEDDFDDNDIAHELGLADAEGEAVAAESPDDRVQGDQDELDGASDFGAPFAESHSDDVSFEAGMTAGAFPFADGEQVDPMGDVAVRGQDHDPASIPLAAAVASTGVAAAVAAGGGRAPAKKKSSGLGQMVGVALGGLMALPITYAILIWGFQKDPFKFGKQVPEQLAFLLPQKLQPGYKPPRKAAAGPSLDAAPSLDDLPMAADAASESTSEPDATAAAEPADSKSEESEGAEDSAEPSKSEPMKTETASDASTAPAADAPPAKPDESPKPGVEPASESIADAVAAAPAMAADNSLAVTLPKADGLPGLDALMADASVSVPAAPPAAQPPLDLTGVETAAERASQAFDALDAMTEPVSPDRDRLLVAWYKRLAQLGEELVRLETIAADSGRPLSSTPDPAADLLDRICGSDAAMADLDRLGGMWLTSQKRRADGVALVVTLGPSRQVGPYWSTRGQIDDSRTDGDDRTIAIISRLAPPADAGERVVVSGVMFDGDAVWAADMRPAAAPPSSEDGQE